MIKTITELAQTGRGWEAPLKLLQLEEGFNVREDATPDAELLSSIEAHGVLRPLHIRNDPDAPGKYFVVDGERRFHAARKAKIKTVPVINEGDLDEPSRLVMSLVTNEGSKPLTAKETAKAFLRLREAGIDDGEIARVMGYSGRKVKETLRALESGDEDLVKGVTTEDPSEKIPPRTAARVADLPPEVRGKIVGQIKGKSVTEGLRAVRTVEKEVGIKRRGRKPSEYPWARDAKFRAEILEKAAKSMLKDGPNRKAEAHIEVIQVLKGKVEPGELYVKLMEKEIKKMVKKPTVKKTTKKTTAKKVVKKTATKRTAKKNKTKKSATKQIARKSKAA